MLGGNFIYDKDFDESTKELLDEILRVSEIIPDRSVDTDPKKRVG